MSSLIERGRAMLKRVAGQQAAPASLTYTAPNGGTCDLSASAWAGRTVFRSNLQERPTLQFGERDYLIPVEDLVIDGVAIRPARGGRFTETLNGTVKTFEIVTPDNGEPAWRYSDISETIYRAHCKRVS